MIKGNIVFFNTLKGFGFIKDEDGQDYFLHVRGLASGVDPLDLHKDTSVKFNMEPGDKGPRATDLILADQVEQAGQVERKDENPAPAPVKKKSKPVYNKNGVLISSARPPQSRNRTYPGESSD